MHLASQIKKELDPHFSIRAFIDSKKGPLKMRYLKAHKLNAKHGFNANQNSDIAAFVKNERYFEEKPPRMIMGRDPRFNLFYSKIICPIETAFFKLPQVANACDFSSCGEKFSKLVGDWFFENDMSKFEASQRWETLRLEYLIYSLVYPEEKDYIDNCFAVKMQKKGSTQSGVKFSFNMCRGSGDMDTGLGNGILNYISTMYFQAANFCPSRGDCKLANCVEGCFTGRFILKGDDSVGSMPVNATYSNTYTFFGFDAKLFCRAAWWEVEFCSGHYVRTSCNKFYYVQKLRKVLTSLETVINPDAIKFGWVAHYYASIGLMMKKLYSGLPVYEDLADFLISGSSLKVNCQLVRDQSYGLATAFENFKSGGKFPDDVLLDISMVNDMSIAELNILTRFLRENRPVYPDSQMLRCNRKNKPINHELHDLETAYNCYTMDFGRFNKVQLLNKNLVTSKELSSWYRSLLKDL